jgi:hypothetical protein
MEEKNLGVNSAPVVEASVSSEPVVLNNPIQTQEQNKPAVAPSLLTQDEVNKIVAGRIRDVTKKLHEKHGVKTEEELNSILAKGQAHDGLQEQLKTIEGELNNLKNEKILRLNKVRGDKMSDVIALLRGKNLPINEANIKDVLKTHPEWVRKRKQRVVGPIGIAQPTPKPVDEKAVARSFFKSLNR